MSGLWIAMAVASLAAIAALAWPLLRRRDAADPSRRGYDLAVWRDQLAEIDRDRERGLIDADQAAAAQIELKRRILAVTVADAAGSEAPVLARTPAGRSRLLALVLAIVVPVAAVAGYLAIGAPGTADQPLVARARSGDGGVEEPGAAAVDPTMAEAIERLQARLAANPDDLQGWTLFGRSLLASRRYGEAATALERAWRLSGDHPAIAADYGEALVGAAGGEIGGEARALFAAALGADPDNAKARYYLALSLAQSGDLPGALQGWVDLVARSPADAPWLAAVREQIDRTAAELGLDPATLTPSADRLPSAAAPKPVPKPAPGPSREQMAAAAAMSAEERAAFIRTMVDQLAARLETNPGDRDGWLRLARAWEVLGEADKAAAARARAAALPPATP